MWPKRLSDLDPTVVPRNLLAGFRHAWRRDVSSQGATGILSETLSSVARTNVYPIFVDADCGWSEHDIEAMLNRYGIKMFGTYHFGEEMIFYVRVRQGNFAEWVLQREGVPLKHGVLNKRIGGKRQRTHKRRKTKPASRSGLLDRLAREFDVIVDELESLLHL